jgi:EAL domain-containing protein (putative c-di-GMP-specific phosphodiesterase class I)
VKATVELGHALGLVVGAEGIEDDKQLIAARALGCDQAQGSFVARPMSEGDVPAWLAGHSMVPDERDEMRTLASTLRR